MREGETIWHRRNRKYWPTVLADYCTFLFPNGVKTGKKKNPHTHKTFLTSPEHKERHSLFLNCSKQVDFT